MQHSEDNPNQIRILAQTLTDGGVMDELINEELETFNSRWRELHEEVWQEEWKNLFKLICMKTSKYLYASQSKWGII